MGTGCGGEERCIQSVVERKGAYRVWWRGKVHTGFGGGNLQERGHLGDIGVDKEAILYKNDLREICLEGVEWIDLA